MKKNIKYLALILILSLVVPLFPSSKVFATSLARMPDFPYHQDSYYNVNNGSFALWQVHGSNYISYVQTFTPSNISYPNPIVIFKESFLETNNSYYLDYTYITDSWDINGFHSYGYAGTQNIAIPKPNESFVTDVEVYATLVYTTENVMWRNGTDVGIYAHWNYKVPSYADPTPTPTPEPEIDTRFPTFINAYKDNYLNNQNRAITKYLVCNRFYDEANSRYEYQTIFVFQRFNPYLYKSTPLYTPTFNGYDYANNILTFYFPNIAERNWNGLYNITQFVSDNYKTENDIYDATNLASGYPSNQMTEPTERNYQFTIDTSSMNYEATAIYQINSDGSCTRLDGDGGDIPATPTPTLAPTPIPQPTTNPEPSPTTPPDVKVVEPSAHWWDGLVKPIQYIFVPSSDKMMKTYNTFADKFGVQKPTKFEFDANALVRPRNITWNFKHVSLDGNDNTVTQITLVDFVMIDGWLESSAGQMIIGIIRAVFTLLMWGYLIYIFQKHIATINYTDAHTLIEQSRKGGDDND